MAINRPASQNKYSEQNMGNTSFDEDFGVNAVEMLVYNASASTLDRMVQPTFSGDIQIGAVEIKNSTDDTRATVGANGLQVDPRTGFTIPPYDNCSLAQATLTDTWTFKVGVTSVATITITYTDSGKGTISTVVKT